MGQVVAECWNCEQETVLLTVERDLKNGDMLTNAEVRSLNERADDLCEGCGKPLRGSLVKAASDLLVSAEGFAG
jgi:hypothetical protein